MKLHILTILLLSIVIAECNHTFVGTNLRRPLVHHREVKYSFKFFKSRVEDMRYVVPNLSSGFGRTIQGILALDLTNSAATANITQGGVGFEYVNIRMKSERGRKIHYDVYIYA